MVRNPRVGETVYVRNGSGRRLIGYVTLVHQGEGMKGVINAACYDEFGAFEGGQVLIRPESDKREAYPYWYWIEEKKPDAK